MNSHQSDKERSVSDDVPLYNGQSPDLSGGTDWIHDPGNAQNWSFLAKVYHTAVPSAIAFLITFASTIYVPGIAGVANEFEISEIVGIIPFSMTTMGLAFGPVVAAPLSETYGRRIVYLVSIPCFALFTMGAGFSQNIAALAICRFFSGFSGSPGLSIGSGTVADIWNPAQRTIPVACLILTPFLGPALGPLIGGYVVDAKGWRWTQWTVVFLSIAIYAASVFIHETHKRAILSKRAKRADQAQTPAAYDTNRSTADTPKPAIFFALVRPIHMLFAEPLVTVLGLYIAYSFAIVYALFAAVPWTYARVYGFDIGSQGLVFLSLAIGYSLGVLTTILVEVARKKRQMEKEHPEDRLGRTSSPEEHLYLAMVGSVAFPISLFWFGWTLKSSIHWIVPTIAIAVYAWGSLLIYMSVNIYLLNTYGPLYGASATAGSRFLSYMMGVAFPLFTIQMFSRLGIQWASSLLGFLSVAMLPIPWVFFRFGPKLRGLSKYMKPV